MFWTLQTLAGARHGGRHGHGHGHLRAQNRNLSMSPCLRSNLSRWRARNNPDCLSAKRYNPNHSTVKLGNIPYVLRGKSISKEGSASKYSFRAEYNSFQSLFGLGSRLLQSGSNHQGVIPLAYCNRPHSYNFASNPEVALPDSVTIWVPSRCAFL